jgi:hypothetical protein
MVAKEVEVNIHVVKHVWYTTIIIYIPIVAVCRTPEPCVSSVLSNTPNRYLYNTWMEGEKNKGRLGVMQQDLTAVKR